MTRLAFELGVKIVFAINSEIFSLMTAHKMT